MYGGRSDDLEYMQEVLKTAERVGDKAYIQRLRNQIEEIKKRQTQPTKPTLATSKKIAKKEEPLKTSEAKTVGKLGDRCTPIVNRGVPGSCETGTVCWSGVNRCCSRHVSGEFYDCGEAGISPIKGSQVPSPITIGTRAQPNSPVPVSPSTPTPIHITDGKMTASPTMTALPAKITASPTPMTPMTPMTRFARWALCCAGAWPTSWLPSRICGNSFASRFLSMPARRSAPALPWPAKFPTCCRARCGPTPGRSSTLPGGCMSTSCLSTRHPGTNQFTAAWRCLTMQLYTFSSTGRTTSTLNQLCSWN